MPVRGRLLPPRHLLVVFVGITLALAAALVSLGVQLVRQDRALQGERVRDRLEGAAVSITVALEQLLAQQEGELRAIAALPEPRQEDSLRQRGMNTTAGALLVLFREHGVNAYPNRRLLYDPVAGQTASPVPPALARIEAMEFRSQDLGATIAAYRGLAVSSDRSVRAAALLRLGRVLRKAGSADSALHVYAQLAAYDSLVVDGLPAGLSGRYMRITILESLRQTAAARSEAAAVYADLWRPRWRLARGSFDYYSEQLRSLLAAPAATASGALAEEDQDRLTLSQAVDSLSRERTARQGTPASERRMLHLNGGPVFVQTIADGDRGLSYFASSRNLRLSLLHDLEPVLARQGVRVALIDPNGTTIATQIDPQSSPQITRPATESGLPWTLRVAARDPNTLAADFAARRRVLLASLVVAVLLALVGTYAVVRAIGRELEVARVQSDFVAAVSHEFRTPLTSLRQLTELLAAGRVTGDERRTQYYEVLRREAARLHRLVEGLLDFGRMEAGAREFHLEPVEPASLVVQAVVDFRDEIAGAGYRIDLRGGDVRCTVRADREALGRAVRNLLDNAVKYSPEHKEVTVDLARENGRFAVHVRDRGIGIPPNERSSIFDNFARGSSAKRLGIRGTGIGLAMVRHIVNGHGGEVRFESVPGEGSTFSILLEAEDGP